MSEDEMKTMAIAITDYLKARGFRDIDRDWLYDQVFEAIENGW